MNAEEAKVLAAKAKEEKMTNRRVDLLSRIGAQARSGNDSLVLGEWLDEGDVTFFENLGFSIIDHTGPMITYTGAGGSSGTYITNGQQINYRYSEISWA